MATSEFFERLEKLGGNHRVRTMIDNVRNVQQGLCSIDDINDYELADRADQPTAENETAGWEEENDMPDARMSPIIHQ